MEGLVLKEAGLNDENEKVLLGFDKLLVAKA